MKTISRLLIACLLMGLFYACANKNKIYEGFCRGVYDASNQKEKIEKFNTVSPTEKPVNYEQYKREREEILIEQGDPQ